MSIWEQMREQTTSKEEVEENMEQAIALAREYADMYMTALSAYREEAEENIEQPKTHARVVFYCTGSRTQVHTRTIVGHAEKRKFGISPIVRPNEEVKRQDIINWAAWPDLQVGGEWEYFIGERPVTPAELEEFEAVKIELPLSSDPNIAAIQSKALSMRQRQVFRCSKCELNLAITQHFNWEDGLSQMPHKSREALGKLIELTEPVVPGSKDTPPIWFAPVTLLDNQRGRL